MNKQRILIFGKQGMLGSILDKELSRNPEYEIIAAARADIDLADAAATKDYIQKTEPNIIINTVAATNVDKCEEDHKYAEDGNLNSVINIVEAIKDSAIFLIHFSTDYIFDGQNPEGYLENALAKAMNYYGETKYQAEQYILEHLKNYQIIRVSWLFGTDHQLTPERQDFVDMVMNWVSKTDTLNIVDDQFGKVSYTYDIAARLASMLPQLEPGIFHLASEGTHSRYEFTKEIVKRVKPEVTVNPTMVAELNINWKAQRPTHSSLVNTKLAPMRGWKEALNDYLDKKLA